MTVVTSSNCEMTQSQSSECCAGSTTNSATDASGSRPEWINLRGRTQPVERPEGE